jgi:hypothetical protein
MAALTNKSEVTSAALQTVAASRAFERVSMSGIPFADR